MAHKIILDFRERRNARKWKHANGGIFKYLDGTPEEGVQRSYIGGSTSEARKKYFNLDKELTQVVTNLATSYGISPALVIDRLAHEGIIDDAIKENNWISKGNDRLKSYFSNGDSVLDNNDFNQLFNLFGLDNIYDTYTRGITKTKRPINIRKLPFYNESGEKVNSGETNNIYDTLELFVAELASRRNQVKLLYPNLTDPELDSATAARYNATNKYFKQLMDSGEYKIKYPINVEGINIPTPTKIDSKYIQSQSKEVNLDESFRNMPYKEYVYNNKSWNPNLFLEDGKVIDPDNKIVKGILEGYAKRNFSEPEQVSFVYKEGAKIHKPNGHRSILDNGWIPTKRLKKGTYGLIKKHRGGGSAIPTVEEYIALQIEARKQTALDKSLTRTLPAYPLKNEVMSEQEWNASLAKREQSTRNSALPQSIKALNIVGIDSERRAGYANYVGSNCIGPTCAKTAADNYGIDFIGSQLFRDNHANYGFKKVDNKSVKPGDIVIDVELGLGSHTMMFNRKDNNNVMRFNHSNGGFLKENIRKDAKYPFKGVMETYTFVGTPSDSILWRNEYKHKYE